MWLLPLTSRPVLFADWTVSWFHDYFVASMTSCQSLEWKQAYKCNFLSFGSVGYGSYYLHNWCGTVKVALLRNGCTTGRCGDVLPGLQTVVIISATLQFSVLFPLWGDYWADIVVLDDIHLSNHWLFNQWWNGNSWIINAYVSLVLTKCQHNKR